MSPDDELFDDDVTAIVGIRLALKGGLPEEALMQQARVLGDALGRVADAEVRPFHFYVHEPIRQASPDSVCRTSGDRCGDRRAASADGAIDPVRAPKGFERAMREDLFIHLAEDAAPGGATAQLRAAVLFVDLAKYTPLTEAMDDSGVVTILDPASRTSCERPAHVTTAAWSSRSVTSSCSCS